MVMLVLVNGRFGVLVMVLVVVMVVVWSGGVGVDNVVCLAC